MGTTLTGNKVKDTYKSLIKITDSTEAGSSAKQLSDGDGNDLGLYVDTDGVFGIGAPANVSLDISSATDAIGLPVGTTANRPTGAAGQMRYNSTTGDFELYDTGWTEIFTTDGGTVSGDVTITGDLIVQGTTVTLNTETIEFEDNILQLNTTQGTPDTATGVVSGISIYRGDGVTQASFLFDDADDTWDLTNNLVVDGSTTVSYLSLGSIETTPSDSAFVYRPTNSSIAMGAAGSEIMRLTAGSGATFTGNFAITSSDFSVNTNDFFVDASSSYVAIGHVNPLYPLHIINSNGNIFKASTSDTIVNMFLENNTQRVDLYSNRGAAAIQVDQNDDSGSYDSTFAITIDNNRYLYINTAGDVLLEGGDLIVDTNTLYVDSANNRVGIGIDSPSELLHIHTGDSGGVANNAADEVLVEGSGDTGITISSPSTNIGTLGFGDNDVSLRGAVRYDHSNDSMNFRVSSNTRMTIDSSGVVQVRNQTPTIQLYNTDTSLSLNQTLGDIDFYQSDASDQGVGTVAKIRAVNVGSIAGYGELAFHTGSATTIDERVRIDYQGNVGIGVTNVKGKLHTSQGDSGQTSANVYASALVVEDNASNGISILTPSSQIGSIFFGDQNDNFVGGFRYDHSDNSLSTSVNNAVAMVIDSAGVVKIFSGGGTSEKTYTALAGLQLYSQQSDAGSPYTKTSDIVANGDGTVPSELRMFTKSNGSSAPTERLRIDSSGNVGIGTSNPSQGNLVISPTAQAADLDGLVLAYNPDGASNRVRAKLYIDSFNGVLDLKSGSDVLTTKITSAGNSYFNGGNVGIGTTSPTNNSKLTVLHDTTGATGATGGLVSIMDDKNMALGNGGGIRFGGIYQTDGTPNADMGFIKSYKENATSGNFSYALTFGTRANGGNPAEHMRIDSSGNVGIGTDNPNFLLTLNAPTGGALQWQYNGGSYLRIEADSGGGSYYAAAGFYHRFFTSGAERMRITSGGQVSVTGAGTAASPSLVVADDSDTGWFRPFSNTIGFATGGSERLRIQSNGAIGINGNNYLYAFPSTSNTSFIGSGFSLDGASNQMTLWTNNTERIHITSGGNVLFGGISNFPSSTQAGFAITGTSSGNASSSGNLTTAYNHLMFYNGNGLVGYISTSGSTTTYSTSGSDLRLKKNIEDWNENVLDSFASIQPKEFHFNVQDDNEEKVKGYIAQDNVDKFPEAYPQNEDGFYSYNPSGMVVYLMKAIQELKAEIETLKSQINN
jgi:hypothetical protein